MNQPRRIIMDQNNNRSPCKKMDLTRKKRKPLMEKRRRARINASLEQLKKLVLDATRRDSARYSKLEKADILELTVKHLRDLQRNNITCALSQDPSVLAQYTDGFSECTSEVSRYLSSIDGISPEVQARLMAHLSFYAQKGRGMMSPRSAQDLSPTAVGLPPLPMFLNNGAGPLSPLYHHQQHGLPMATGMHSPPTPVATPVRALPGHSGHISPTPGKTHFNENILKQHLHCEQQGKSNMHEDFMHKVALQERIMQNQKSSSQKHLQPHGGNTSPVGASTASKFHPKMAAHELHLQQSQNRENNNNGLLGSPVKVKSEPLCDYYQRGLQHGLAFREHVRSVEGLNVLRDNVWRPW